jgi:predicted ester cyclase
MESQQMKDLVIRFVDQFWSSGNLDAAAREMMTSDVIIHEPQVEGGNVEGLKAFATMLRGALPDWHSTAEQLVAEGDMVVERWTGRGTFKGPLFGAQPTGAQITLPGVVFYRIRDGKISEFRGVFDQYALLQQIGLIPA